MSNLFASPPFWSALGCTVVTIPISSSGALLFACSTLWTAANELRNQVVPKHTADGQKSSSAWQKYVKEKLASPGFFPFLQFIIYLWSGAHAILAHKIFHALALFLQAIGALALERIANFAYAAPAREKLAIERVLLIAWSRVPKKIQMVLQDPGAFFCLGAMLLTLIESRWDQFSNASLILQTSMYLGLGILSLAVLRGFWPLLTDSHLKESGAAIHLGGVGHFLLAISSYYVGSPFTAAALVLWGISNILYGLRIDAQAKLDS